MDNICRACNSTKLEDLGWSTDAHIFRCCVCKSLFNFDSSDLHKDKDTSYGQAYRNHFDNSKVEKLYQLFREHHQKHENSISTLIDIGCSDGSFLSMFRDKGWEIFGLDCDMNAISALKEKGINTVFGKLGEQIEMIYAKFDIITLWDVIEHIENISTAMNWMSNALKEGGYIFVVTPNADSLLDIAAHLERRISFGKSQNLMNICLNRYHVSRFSLQGLTILFERYGFEIIKLTPVQLFSLKSSVYLDGFAPGIKSVTSKPLINQFLSSLLFKLLLLFNIKNKSLLVARKC